MLDREGQAVVDGRHGDARLLVLPLLPLDVPQQPVVVATICVPDDVVQYYELLEL